MTDAVRTWLEVHGLAQYATLFAQNDIDLDVVLELTDDDLKELGISLGHRKRLLKAIAEATAAADQHNAPRVDKAERRQLTVLVCDLVDSTSLSVRFDPEDLRAIIGEFQQCCEHIVAKFGGNVARYMGDGLLVYFGYPVASENDPENAVRAGKEIAAAVSRISPRADLRLHVRIGIATGAVIVGDLIGEGASQEQSVVGETPNLAKRLQALAAPDTVVISDATRRLVGGLFECVDLGLHSMKGFDAPVLAWCVADEAVAESRFEALRSGTKLSRLIGRDREIQRLLQLWRNAASGEGQAAALVGEAGIGKSRLALQLREQITQMPHWLLTYSCAAHYQESALFPIINRLERAAGFVRDDDASAKLDKLEAMVTGFSADLASGVPLYASLLSIPMEPRYAPPDVTPRLLKERTFALLEQHLEVMAAERPVLVIFEDLHWVDPTTLELLERMVQRVRQHPILLLMTARPSFHLPWSDKECETIQLSRLGSHQAADIVADVVGGKRLPHEVVDLILDKADGIPLFVEELTRAMIESGQLREEADRFDLRGSLPELNVPSTLRDSLTSRLDRLGAAKQIAEIGAAIGRQFSYELIAAVAPQAERGLRDGLNRLADSKILNCVAAPPHSIYTFRHALIQDAAYAGLLLSERRRLHGRIAKALERNAATAPARPELLAYHYTKAGDHTKAISRWQEAGTQARDRAAHAEAIKHLGTALDLIETLPKNEERGQLELQLRVALGINLEATGGYTATEVAQNYARARELCTQLGYTTETVPVLLGLFVFHLVRADHHVAKELAEQCVAFSEHSNRTDYLIDSCAALGHVLPHLGEIEQSVPVLRRCIELSESNRGNAWTPITAQDPAIASLCQLGIVLWTLGYPDQAVQKIEAAFAIAQTLDQPINVALICPYAAEIHTLRGEPDEAIEYAGRGSRAASEHGYDYWHLLNATHLGIAKAMAGQLVDGAALAAGAIEALRGAGAQANLSYFLRGSAEAALRAGDVERAVHLIGESFEMAERTHEHFFLALMHQTRGEIKLALSEPDEHGAEADFLRAIDIAALQSTLSARLRAETSLHRLHLAQNRGDESRRRLADTYDSFTEGAETADLRAARSLLAVT